MQEIHVHALSILRRSQKLKKNIIQGYGEFRKQNRTYSTDTVDTATFLFH